MTLAATRPPAEAPVVFLAPGQVPMRQARSQRYDRLTPADCALLHEASIAILERTGVRIHDAEAVERLRGAGARVGDDGRVFVPGSLVEWALDVTPKSVRLHDRSGAPALALQGDNAYFGVGSDCNHAGGTGGGPGGPDPRRPPPAAAS